MHWMLEEAIVRESTLENSISSPYFPHTCHLHCPPFPWGTQISDSDLRQRTCIKCIVPEPFSGSIVWSKSWEAPTTRHGELQRGWLRGGITCPLWDPALFRSLRPETACSIPSGSYTEYYPQMSLTKSIHSLASLEADYSTSFFHVVCTDNATIDGSKNRDVLWIWRKQTKWRRKEVEVGRRGSSQSQARGHNGWSLRSLRSPQATKTSLTGLGLFQEGKFKSLNNVISGRFL